MAFANSSARKQPITFLTVEGAVQTSSETKYFERFNLVRNTQFNIIIQFAQSKWGSELKFHNLIALFSEQIYQ